MVILPESYFRDWDTELLHCPGIVVLRAGDGDSHSTVTSRTFILYTAHFPEYQEKDQLHKLQTSLPVGPPSWPLRSHRWATKCTWRATIWLVDNSTPVSVLAGVLKFSTVSRLMMQDLPDIMDAWTATKMLLPHSFITNSHSYLVSPRSQCSLTV